MGCDIHFRVEYYAPTETVTLKDGQVVVAQDGPPRWQPAEKLSPSRMRLRWEEELQTPVELRLGQSTDAQLKAWISLEPEMELAYEDRFYTGRNYPLFYKLAGVRGEYEDIEPMSDYGNGLPDDMSPEVADELGDDGDLHSHSHYTLTELLDECDWQEFDRQSGAAFYETILKMHVVAIEKCGGNTDHVRAVFAFDN